MSQLFVSKKFLNIRYWIKRNYNIRVINYIFFLKNFRIQKIWYHRIGDSNTTNLWRHIEKYHSEKDPRPKKAKNLIAEDQGTLDNFVNQMDVSFKVSILN